MQVLLYAKICTQYNLKLFSKYLYNSKKCIHDMLPQIGIPDLSPQLMQISRGIVWRSIKLKTSLIMN
jgi:hypothetical protein